MIQHWQEILLLKKRAIGLHRNFNDEPITWAITDEVINFLLDNLNPHMKTLETGIGLSTFAFGVSETHHSVLSYNEDEVQRFKEICRTNNWSFHKMEFYLERSELILPQLPRRPDYDLILIDGGHGFPTPYIDWFYSSSLLKTGGFMILDDIQLPIVFKLYQFLCEHPHWQLEKNYLWQSAIFRKISPQAGYRVEDWYHHNWLKRPHWPRWMIYTFWVPLSGNTATHKRLSHLLDFIFVRHFFSPLYYHVLQFAYYSFIRKFYLHVLCKVPQVLGFLATKGSYLLSHYVYYQAVQKLYYKTLHKFYHCFVVKIYHSVIIKIYFSIIVRFYYSILVKIYYLLIYSPAVKLYYSVIMRFYYFVVLRVYYSLIKRLYHSVLVKIYYSLIMRFYYSVLVRIYYSVILKFHYTVIQWIYWRIARPIPIHLKCLAEKTMALFIRLIWISRIPDIPGLCRMWFWKCIPLCVRRENLKRLFYKISQKFAHKRKLKT